LELLGAAELNLRVSQLHFVISDSRLGRAKVGFRGIERFASVGVVEGGE